MHRVGERLASSLAWSLEAMEDTEEHRFPTFFYREVVVFTIINIKLLSIQ
jgi:hypothetical protein